MLASATSGGTKNGGAGGGNTTYLWNCEEDVVDREEISITFDTSDAELAQGRPEVLHQVAYAVCAVRRGTTAGQGRAEQGRNEREGVLRNRSLLVH